MQHEPLHSAGGGRGAVDRAHVHYCQWYHSLGSILRVYTQDSCNVVLLGLGFGEVRVIADREAIEQGQEL